MGVAVAEKMKILLVGGMEYNVPKEIGEFFEVVRHITQGAKVQTLPKADYVFVVTEWASHNLVETVKAQVDVPIIPLARGGWQAIKQDLLRRSILEPEQPVQKAAIEERESSESLFSAMTEADVWKKYGSAIIEAAQVTLKPKEIVCEDDVLEVLSLSGVPKEDCRVYLPKLQMKGILDPVSDGKWRLMAAPGTDFDNEKADPENVASEKSKKNVVTRDHRRQVKSPELIGLIAGLNKGPYSSKRAVFEEMRKYVQFDALSDWQAMKYIDRAIEQKIVDDTHQNIFVNQNCDIHLTSKKVMTVEPEMPESPEKIVRGAKAEASPALSTREDKRIEKSDAEKAWCYVVEGVKREKDRLGSVLEHCRIEWMGDNKVLVIFIPAVLAQWQKFLESTDNWGLVSRMVQDRLSRNTAIRFMVDNGLGG
jgi:hypothetical protein